MCRQLIEIRIKVTPPAVGLLVLGEILEDKKHTY